jgi:V-type H+-transporting ATPase subunit A
MMGFHDEAQKAVAQGQSWAKVREATQELQAQLRSLKFELPSDGQEKVCKKVRSPFTYLLLQYAIKPRGCY